MCGIFGVININEKIDESRVLAARDLLAHRGPDDSGIYFSPNHAELSVIPSSVSSRAASRDEGRGNQDEGLPYVALAHRRLSIIDLSPAAHQPMSTSDGRYTIVYNGEIYNYVELSQKSTLPTGRQEVKCQKLRSNSDTEIILNLYAEYGKDCLSMLRGMFAFAIWDDKEKTLFAARDRYGIKPFYYLKNENEFIFSSEIKAIKHYKNNLTISNEGIDAFLRTGSVPAPITIYSEVHSLLPGHYLEMRDQKLEISKYWDFGELVINTNVMLFPRKWESKIKGNADSRFHRNDRIKGAKSLRGVERRSNLRYNDDAKQKIREALLDTIKAHMVSDVEVGAFLSGGIDSTAIVSLMRQVGQEKIKTVSVVFPGNKLDESKYARLAAKTYSTEHIEIPFYEKDLLDDFENIMAVIDQPTIDGINTYFVSKAAKQAGLKVVLSGLGGDELFGGYPSFSLIPKYKRIKYLPFAKMFMKAAAPLLKNRLPAKAIAYMKKPDEPNAEYKLVRGLFADDELKALGWKDKRAKNKVKSENAATNDTMTTNDNFTSDVIANEVKQSLSTLQYVSMMETTYYMRNQLLRDSDVFSMSHSLELRVPFVDHLLYEAVLPYLDYAYDKSFPKKMLVEAVGDLPDEIIHRPKMGFTFPFADWMMNGQLKDLISLSIKNLENTSAISYQPSAIGKLHWSRLWALYVLSKTIKEQDG